MLAEIQRKGKDRSRRELIKRRSLHSTQSKNHSYYKLGSRIHLQVPYEENGKDSKRPISSTRDR